ncbi:MAG: glycosyltransferase [Chloroflexi bacterium]|nr:glycosyltransferase [Chloroflexota bacterium]
MDTCGPSRRAAGRSPQVRPWRPRVALYSHDTVGLGHTRRNLLIAQALAAPPCQATILLVCGAREACSFALPEGVDCLTLPALSKDTGGRYASRRLNLPLSRLVDLRAEAIRAALVAFGPEVLIVDKVPRGALGELDPTLADLRASGQTRCVLGLREVLDDPTAVREEWWRDGNEAAIGAYYDAVWVYGDPRVYDPVREYQLGPEVKSKVRYTGYLDQSRRLELEGGASVPPEWPSASSGRLILCLLGGGQDGQELAEAFAGAGLPPDSDGVLLLGPYLPPEARRRAHEAAAQCPRLTVLDFLAEPAALLRRADRVIAMGGYNTVCEVLSFQKHALIVPRVKPRTEQLIRAERLCELGLVHVLSPDRLTPQALTDWIARDLEPLPPVRERMDFDGLSRLPALLREVLTVVPRSLDRGWSQSYAS